MVHSPNMMMQQHPMMTRQRKKMHPEVHGGPMMSTHPQQSMGQNAVLPPHSHQVSSQMMAPHMMTRQQQMPVSNPTPQQSHPAQQPCPPSKGVAGEGSPLPGQLGGPQFHIAMPPQSQATPTSQQSTPSQQPAPGVTPLSSVSILHPTLMCSTYEATNTVSFAVSLDLPHSFPACLCMLYL